MSDDFGGLRCEFCFATGQTCRNRLAVGAPKCCNLCVCAELGDRDRPIAPGWTDLGVGGKPIHPPKCGGPLGMVCAYCAATHRYKAVMQARERSAIPTTGESVR